MKTRVIMNFSRVGRARDNACYLGKAAFTLIEMLTTVAVLVIGAAISFPSGAMK